MMSETLWTLIVGAVIAFIGVGVAALSVSSHPDRVKAAKLFFSIGAFIVIAALAHWTISTGRSLLVRTTIDLLAFALTALSLIAGFRFADRGYLAELGIPSSAFIPEPSFLRNKKKMALVVMSTVLFTTLSNLGHSVASDFDWSQAVVLLGIPWRWVLPSVILGLMLSVPLLFIRRRKEGYVPTSTHPIPLPGTEEKARDQKLSFEIDESDSQVRVERGGPEVSRIIAEIRLRCLKTTDSVMAVRAFHVSLHRSWPLGDEAKVIDQEESQTIREHLDGRLVLANQGWTIKEPMSGYRNYQFNIEITPELHTALTPDHFLRLTMDAVGQKLVTQTVYVNDWTLPISGISLKPREEFPLAAQKEINRLNQQLRSYEKTNEALGRFNEKYKWLTERAVKERNEIDNWVSVKASDRGDLNILVPLGSPQTVRLSIWVTNKSVLDISLSDNLGGFIKFQDMKLKDTKEVVNHVKDLTSGETACLTIEHRLTPAEVKAILDGQYSVRPQYFNFDELVVNIEGGARSPDIPPKPLKLDATFANAFPINLIERGQRIRALAEVRGSAVQLNEPLRIESSKPLPTSDIEHWVSASLNTLERAYDSGAAKNLWREITHDEPIPAEAAASQRQWLHGCIVVLGSQLAYETGEYIRQPPVH